MTLCLDHNPWDSSVTCKLEPDHDGLHENPHQYGANRWASFCHFPGDDCPEGTHGPEVT